MARGNHDFEGGWSHLSDWPPGFHEMPSDQVASVPVQVDGRLVATVHGISYAQRHEQDNLALRFPKPLPDGRWGIGRWMSS